MYTVTCLACRASIFCEAFFEILASYIVKYMGIMTSLNFILINPLFDELRINFI